VVGRARQMKSRMPCGDAFDFCNASAVANVILRIGFRPATRLGQHRLRVDAHDGVQLLARNLNQVSIVLLRKKFRTSAADEDANQFAILGRTMRKLL
jgi:hypothetical protein